MKKIISIGANSFIAQELERNLGIANSKHRFFPSQFDIEKFIDIEKPDVIINCIGRTGVKNIDWCQEHKEATAFANTILPIAIANIAEQRNIRFIHLSSGCIFYDTSPNVLMSFKDDKPYVERDLGWEEFDEPKEIKSIYAQSKYDCDKELKQNRLATLLRIRMPISALNHPRNLLNKLLSFERIVDAFNSMTFTSELVRIIDWIIKNDKFGIYNTTSPKPLKHKELLEEYCRITRKKYKWIDMMPYDLDQMTVAPRSNCILSTNKLTSQGFEFEDTYTVMKRTIKEFVKNQRNSK